MLDFDESWCRGDRFHVDDQYRNVDDQHRNIGHQYRNVDDQCRNVDDQHRNIYEYLDAKWLVAGIRRRKLH